MEQVLNAEERNWAFLKFLLYFTITVALVVMTVYFNFHIPTEQNKRLQKANDAQNAVNDKEDKFVMKMETVSRLLDSFNRSGVNNELIRRQIDQGITDMISLQSSANPLYQKLNATSVENFSALKREKELSYRQEETIKKLKEEKDELRQKFNDAVEQARMYNVPSPLQGY